MTDEPKGIRAFDLTAPTRLLAPQYSPLLQSPQMRERVRREAEERRARVTSEQQAAYGEWRQYFDRHYANRLARAAFDLHRPGVGYERVVCDECMESDSGDEAVNVTWPCPTYAAMKEADASTRPADTGRFDELLADIKAADGARLLKLGQQVALAHLEEHAITEAQYRELDRAWRDQVERLMLPSDARAAGE